MERIPLTKAGVLDMPFAPRTTIVGDAECGHLYLRIGKTRKTYFVQRKTRAGLIKRTIGDATRIVPAAARKRADEIVYELSRAPRIASVRSERITLEAAWQDYRKYKKLRPSSLKSYENAMSYLAEFKPRALASITKAEIKALHQKMGDDGHQALANLVMRVFRAVYNYTRATEEDTNLPPCPVEALTKGKLMYRIKRRRGLLTSDQIPPFLQALEQYEDRMLADYFLLLLMTGLRRDEGKTLRWEDVDMKAGLFSVRDGQEKNHEPHTLPMTPTLRGIFERREAARVNEWVFPGRYGKGHIVLISSARDELEKASGVTFAPHDLRRTFTTVAESLDISGYTLKRLLNHKMSESDVTGGYIIWNPERLREPMLRIEAALLKGTREPASGS